MPAPNESASALARRLKLRELRVFVAVVEARGIARAAQRLHTSQPAVSRTVAGLEQMLGARLLHRETGGVRPTGHGQALFDCAVAMFDELRRGVERLASVSDPAAGHVRIGCNPVLAASFVAAVIGRVQRRFPRVRMELSVGPSEALHGELQERKVDLLVTRFAPGPSPPGTRFEHLFDDTYVIAAGVRHPLARRRRIALAELASHPWALPPDESATSRAVAAAFRKAGSAPPEPSAIAIPLEARLGLLAGAQFLTALPASVLRLPARRTDVCALPIALGVAPAQHGIVTRKGRVLSPAAELFAVAAREVAKSFG